MKLSVVIPTYNRKKTLEKCLKALSEQTYSKSEYEVLIVDDSSSDGTEFIIKEFCAAEQFPIRYFRQAHKGPAAARNYGITNAEGEIVLFLGDDIIAEPELLTRHADWHLKNPARNMALLGYVTWDPDLEITPFMRWLENGGPQFNFNELTDGAEADPCKSFYTCNISLKRKFLLENGLFDEDFPSAAFEDLELGGRLKGAGLKLFLDRKAAAWHHHYTSLKDACSRMVRIGELKRIMNRKTGLPEQEPKSPLIRRVFKVVKIGLYYPIAVFFERRKVVGGIYKYVMEYHRARGVENSRDGQK